MITQMEFEAVSQVMLLMRDTAITGIERVEPENRAKAWRIVHKLFADNLRKVFPDLAPIEIEQLTIEFASLCQMSGSEAIASRTKANEMSARFSLLMTETAGNA